MNHTPASSEEQAELSKPLKDQKLILVATYKDNLPMVDAYCINRETISIKPSSRQEQLAYCQVDANHLANAIVTFARMLEKLFSDKGMKAADYIEDVCEYLATPAEKIADAESVVLTIDFDPQRTQERYRITREVVNPKPMDKEAAYIAMKCDLLHLANAVRFLANIMDEQFKKEFNVSAGAVLGNMSTFLKRCVAGKAKAPLNILK